MGESRYDRSDLFLCCGGRGHYRNGTERVGEVGDHDKNI